MYQTGKGHQRKIEVLEPDERLLGLTSEGILYMKADDKSEKLDVYVTNGFREKQYDFGVVEGDLRSAFTVKDTLVLHVSDDNHARSRILFWNMADKNIYGYNATENLMITGCKEVSEPEWQQKNRKSLLEMQGVGNRVKHIMGRVRTSEEDQEIVLNRWKDRMKSWNMPALICCLLLCGLSTFVLFTSDALESVREYRGLSYHIERLVCSILFLLVITISAKTCLPFLLKCIKKDQFFGIGGTAIVVMYSIAAMMMMDPDLIVFWFRVEHMLLLWIPFACWYSLNRPKGNMIWFLLSLLMTHSFVYGAIYLQDDYSTTYLLQLAMTAVATIVIAEFFRSRRSFRAGLIRIGILMVATVGSCWFLLRSKGVLTLLMERMESRLLNMRYWWGSLNNRCRQVLQGAQWFGSAKTEFQLEASYKDTYSMDYVQRYFINFLIREYGLVLGISAALLAVIFVWALIRGARRQICKLDRSICMSCAAYFGIQLLIALPANFGLQWLPPYRVDFMNISVGNWTGGILALGIYMAFYEAHRQSR